MPTPKRRSPATPVRVRDAERTRQALLDAARVEFAAKGLAGARVNDIADRAGVNKQLISYYFGGKQGLYDAIAEEWLAFERGIQSTDIDLGELVCRYLDVTRTRPDMQRLFLRENLDGDASEAEYAPDSDDLVEMRRRQTIGEISPELDPAFVLLVLEAAVSLGMSMPLEVKRHLGLDPTSDEYFALADAQLRLIARRLGAD